MTPDLPITIEFVSTRLTPIQFGDVMFVLGKRFQTCITADNTTNRQIPINIYNTKSMDTPDFL
jgi:hypothetical protein